MKKSLRLVLESGSLYFALAFAAGFALMLLTEFGFVLRLRGLTLEQYFQVRDPVSGAVYYALLGIMALMPLLARWRRAG